MRSRKDLDAMKCDCGVPACEERMCLRPRCHPDAGQDVQYFDGVLTLNCHTCGQLVDEVAVA